MYYLLSDTFAQLFLGLKNIDERVSSAKILAEN